MDCRLEGHSVCRHWGTGMVLCRRAVMVGMTICTTRRSSDTLVWVSSHSSPSPTVLPSAGGSSYQLALDKAVAMGDCCQGDEGACRRPCLQYEVVSSALYSEIRTVVVYKDVPVIHRPPVLVEGSWNAYKPTALGQTAIQWQRHGKSETEEKNSLSTMNDLPVPGETWWFGTISQV